MTEYSRERVDSEPTGSGPAATGEPAPAGAALAAREEWSLQELLLALGRGRRTILGCTVAGGLLAAAFLALATPIYTARALVQIVSGDGVLSALGGPPGALAARLPTESEIEVLRSRRLLGTVVDELGLDVSVRPRAFPVLGAAIARACHGSTPAAAPLEWLDRFAWGCERIAVSRLVVDEALVDAPLLLVALGQGRYQVRDPRGVPRIDGVVGAAARSVDGAIQLFVSELSARPGTHFVLTRLDRSAVVADLQRRLRVHERGRKTGVLALKVDGASPARDQAALAAIAATYLRQHAERRAADAARTLEILETHLPAVRSRLHAAEVRLAEHMLVQGSVDPPRETQAALARAAALERAISAVEVERAQLRGRYTDGHPVVVELAAKLAELRRERGLHAERIRRIPGVQLETVRLDRDVERSAELYLRLLEGEQALRLARSGTVGDLRVVDRAEVSSLPTRPRRSPVMAVGLVLGLATGVALALSRRAPRAELDDPHEIERSTGLPVHAAIPFSAAETAFRRAARHGGTRWNPLALAAPDDPAIEPLRSLRSALPLALAGAGSNVVVVTSASRGAGKSFVAVNLALLVAGTGRRVLLIDADLREGRLHRHFAQERRPGLSDLARGEATSAEATRRPDPSGPDVVFSGTASPGPAELLASPRMPRMLAELARGYDLVIVDTPSVLAVTDPTLLASVAGATLLVVDACRDTLPDLNLAMSRLTQSGARAHGLVLNRTIAVPRADHAAAFTEQRRRS